MRVLMIAANTERINLPTLPLGPAMVAAATRAAGHEVAFLDLMGETDPGAVVRRTIGSFRPEAIGVSVRNIDDQDMANPVFLLDKVRPVVAACRTSSDAPIVLGGAGFTLFPEATLAELGADFGVCGEGERTFPALLNRIENGLDLEGLSGVYAPGCRPSVPRATVDDLDDLPLVDGELWAASDLDEPDVWVPVQTRRGCPYRCTYCSTPRIEGGVMRLRSPRRVVEQIRHMADGGVRRLQFVDNTFNIPPPYALDLCREIQALEAGLKWMCILYPHGIDEPLVRAMSNAGCAMASLGFESGCDRILKTFDKRFDTTEVRRISDLLSRHGIRRFGFLLLGGPGETRDSVTESLDFVESLELEMLRVTVGIRIYPGTPLADLAVEEGVTSADEDLLRPRFYMTPGLEDFIREELARRLPTA
jgi:radical SAM superfamily enzyme YgiQ (UPF0313 family)